VGRIFGSYRVLEVLGEGATGLVYLAEHVRLGRRVAMKRLKDRLAARPEAVEMLFTEARAVNRINHPHIVDITDFVVSEGYAYYLMEYLRGETLAALLRREGPLPPSRAVTIARQVAAALKAAHDAGFVHLDIKPSNIYLVETGQQTDTVKLLDFGTAMLLETVPRPEGPNRSGMFNLGTPVYMSPEQAAGEEVDHRSDLYSLGAVLYEMLAGRPPFEAQSAPEYIYKHMSVTPQRITQIKGLPYRIPRGCSKAVMRCLEKEPKQRPQSATDLIELFDKGATITEFEVSPGAAPALSRVPRSPARLGVMIAAVVVALGLGWVLLTGNGEDRPVESRRAVAPAAAQWARGATVPRVGKTVLLLLKTTPPLARVKRLSPDPEVLGLTPLLYRAPRGSQPWKLELTLNGHRPQRIELVPDRERRVTLVLSPAARPRAEPMAAPRKARRRRARPRRPRARPRPRRSSKVDTVRTVDPFQ
jgi:serine/threonine-protein kinase